MTPTIHFPGSISVFARLRRRLLPTGAFLLGALGSASGATAPTVPAEAMAVTNPAYVLAAGDTIIVTVAGEPELRTASLIAQDGTVRLPLVGNVRVEGLAVRQAEVLLAKSYREGEFLRNPEVQLHVTDYTPSLVTVLGAVRTPGKITFPREKKQLEIVDAITQSGGFLPVAKGDAVVVTRTDASGRESQQTVDVAALMSGKRKDDKPAVFFLQPGDRIFVPERLF
jgi:polysaccharide export outer membrane protein